MKKALLLPLLLFGFAIVKAQLPQVSGYISDFQTGETIHGAIVSDSSGNHFTYSNKDGYYNLGLGTGIYTLFVTSPGYQKQKFYLEVYGSRDLNVGLKQLKTMSEDTASSAASTINDYRSGHISPLIKQVQNMSAPLNVADPIKLLQYMPGVNGGIEGLAGMYVRGGNADQNLITMDGLPVYGNGHVFGFLSGFNTDLVKDMQFYKGVAPARYGGRAGAVLDVSMNDGNKKDWKGNFSGDILTMKLNMDGPISDKTTLSLGIRRSWIDLLLPKTSGSYVFYNLHDLNGKVVYTPDKNNKFSFWAYNGRDKYGLKFSDAQTDSNNRTLDFTILQTQTWQNTLLGANWSHRISSRHYSTILVGLSRYSNNSNFELEGTVTTDTSSNSAKIGQKQINVINDFIAKADLEYHLINGAYLRYGGEIIHHGFKPSISSEKLVSNGRAEVDSTFGNINIQGAVESAIYGEYEAKIAPGMKVNAGARLWLFAGRDKVFLRPEPRIMLTQLLQGKKAIKFGASIANQGIHQLGSVNASLPGNIWFPSSSVFNPQQTIQFTGGYYRPLKKGIEFSVDGYYKILNGVADLTGADKGDLLENYWVKMLAQGKGTAYGLEGLLMKKHGRFNGLLGYTLAFSNRTIEDINFGKTYPFRWDRRHKVSFTGVYHVNNFMFINFGLVIMTGNAVSVPTGKYVAADGTFIYDYTEKNNFRMPLYRRIDFGFTKRIHPERSQNQKQYWGINIYNLLNSFNPMFIDLQRQDGALKTTGTSVPFVPSIFYKWEF